jgi:hypothetical protein
VAAAAAHRVAEAAPLEAEPAAGARGREQLGLDEQGTHQAPPQEHEAEDEWAVHIASYRHENDLG